MVSPSSRKCQQPKRKRSGGQPHFIHKARSNVKRVNYEVLVNVLSVLLQVQYARCSLGPNLRYAWLHSLKGRVETVSWHYEILYIELYRAAHAVNNLGVSAGTALKIPVQRRFSGFCDSQVTGDSHGEPVVY